MSWQRFGQLRARYDTLTDGVALFAIIPHTPQHVMGTHCGTVEFREIPADGERPKLLTLNREQSAKLMSDLWASGVRPLLTRDQTLAFVDDLWAAGYRPTAARAAAATAAVVEVLERQVELMQRIIEG